MHLNFSLTLRRRLFCRRFYFSQFERRSDARGEENAPKTSVVTSVDRHDDNRKELKKIEKALLSERQEKFTRERLVSKYMSVQERELEEQRQKLQKALDGYFPSECLSILFVSFD